MENKECSLRSIRNVLLDFDGTLCDTESVFASKLDGLFGLDGKALFHTYLFDIHRKVVHKRYPKRHDDMEFHWRLLLKHLGEPYDRSKIDLLNVRFKEAKRSVMDCPVLFHESELFLDRAVKSDFRLCLSTGGGNSMEKAEAITRALGSDYFFKVLGEETLGQLKHEPSYYREALKRLSWRVENTASIGDTILTDISPAKVVGIKTIWVNRRNDKRPTDPERIPDYETSNLMPALDYLNL